MALHGMGWRWADEGIMGEYRDVGCTIRADIHTHNDDYQATLVSHTTVRSL